MTVSNREVPIIKKVCQKCRLKAYGPDLITVRNIIDSFDYLWSRRWRPATRCPWPLVDTYREEIVKQLEEIKLPANWAVRLSRSNEVSFVKGDKANKIPEWCPYKEEHREEKFK